MHRIIRHTLSLLIALAIGTTMSLSLEAAEPRLSIEGEEIIIAGLTPAGNAVLLGVSYESVELFTRISRRDLILTADGGGDLRHNPGGGSQARSTWAVVDLSTGAHSVASSARDGGRQYQAPADLVDRLVRDASRFRIPGDRFDILVAQPGVGSWMWTGGDGGMTDRDSSPGFIEFHATDLRPLETTPAPPSLFPIGAIVVVIDIATLDFFTLQVTR